LVEILQSGLLVDRTGRIARKLRISVTDRCNFACLFCMPEKDKISFIPEEKILSFEEIERIVRIMASLGIRKVRITGGEPLLRKNIEVLIRKICSIEGIESVDMTTNGWFLHEKAMHLKESGLRGVTVSLHSLRKENFRKISGVDALERVIQGIQKAKEVGLNPIKINTVAIKGYNDDEIPSLVDFAIRMNASLRFIEFMPLDGLGIWSQERVMTGEDIINIISKYYNVSPIGRGKGETSSLWSVEGRQTIGLITPISEPFCDDCDRIRLTSDGKLLSCLFDVEYHDMLSLLREGRSDSEIARFIVESVWKKPDGIAYMPWIKNGWQRPRAMNAIGG
jgi:cyclic pyranopterin phosphate synthase